MRLIDLDQTIFVPIVDESKGGVKYEMQMTVGEMFDKFCEGFKPEVVDAIPVEWLRKWPKDLREGAYVRDILQDWQKKQEAR